METLDAKDRREWREWLEKNAAGAGEIWLLYYKKNSGKPGIGYEDSVEEALCFGWVDSIIRRVDELRCARKFTPRKPRSRWSESNMRRVKKLLAEGRMTAAGMQAFEPEKRRNVPALPAKLPADLETEFRAHRGAWENFQQFPPFYRRMTGGWIASAKREETRRKRLQRLIEFSARQERIKFI